MNLAAKILIGALLLETVIFAFFYIRDIIKAKPDFKSIKPIPIFIIGLLCNFFDTLGIGSYATSTTSFKFTKTCQDDLIPGTLNCAYAIPVVVEAVVFMDKVDVEPLTLVLMIVAAVLGSIIGVKLIAKWNINMIRYALGTAMICLAIVMFCKNSGFGPFGAVGTLTGLEGVKLVIGVIGNFFLGAFMIAGLGLYNPCMALVMALGMSANVVFPIMMGSCAFLMPVAGIEFIKEGKYDRATAPVLTFSGIIGALIACFIITSLPLKVLTYIVCIVMVYGAVTFFRDAKKA